MPMIKTPRNLLFRLSDQKGRVTIASLMAIAIYLLTFPLEIGLRISLAYDFAVATFLALLAIGSTTSRQRICRTTTRIGNRATDMP